MMQPTPNESHVPTDELVDIREVSVDKNLPKEERIAAFIRQIKNPYRFRCGDFVVQSPVQSSIRGDVLQIHRH